MRVCCLFILVAYFYLAFAQNQCLPLTVNTCITTYTSCVQAAFGQVAATCECFRAYGTCLQAAGCLQSDSAFTTFQQQCQAATCGSDVCLVVVVVPATTETVPATTTVATTAVVATGPLCTQEAALVCAQDYAVCVQGRTNQSEVCACFQTYGACLQTASCIPGTQFDAFQVECLAASCAPDICRSAALPPSCNTESASACQRGYESCSLAAPSDLCACYTSYGSCLKAAGCTNGTEFITFQQRCIAATCSAAICGTAVVVPGGCASCTTARASCIAATTPTQTQQVCDCYQAEQTCLIQSNCNSTEAFQLFQQNCQIARCGNICLAGPVAVSCTAQQSTSCANAFSLCSLKAQGNRQTLCTCYATWGTCLNSVGCTSGTDFDTFSRNCNSAGCGSICPGGVGTFSSSEKMVPSLLVAGVLSILSYIL